MALVPSLERIPNTKAFVPGGPAKVQRSERDKLVRGEKSYQKQGLFLPALCGRPSVHISLLYPCASGSEE